MRLLLITVVAFELSSASKDLLRRKTVGGAPIITMRSAAKGIAGL
jgi:hypothetical protein